MYPASPNPMQNIGLNNKSQTNYLNYKIVKCKNWEKDRTCKYGAHCTFAHGDEDLRNKADNLYQMNNNFNNFQMMVPMVMPGMDMNQMQQLMLSNQLMMGMGMNPAMPNQNLNQNNPNATQGKNEMQTDEK
jgi:hypothetical protein